jgi:hypothetical protein
LQPSFERDKFVMSYISVGRSFANTDYNLLHRVSSVADQHHWELQTRHHSQHQQQLNICDQPTFPKSEAMTLWPTLDHPRHRQSYVGTRHPEPIGLTESQFVGETMFDGITDFICGQYGADDDGTDASTVSTGNAGPQHAMAIGPPATTVSYINAFVRCRTASMQLKAKMCLLLNCSMKRK